MKNIRSIRNYVRQNSKILLKRTILHTSVCFVFHIFIHIFLGLKEKYTSYEKIMLFKLVDLYVGQRTRPYFFGSGKVSQSSIQSDNSIDRYRVYDLPLPGGKSDSCQYSRTAQYRVNCKQGAMPVLDNWYRAEGQRGTGIV